jgi:hypothetical protein
MVYRASQSKFMEQIFLHDLFLIVEYNEVRWQSRETWKQMLLLLKEKL